MISPSISIVQPKTFFRIKNAPLKLILYDALPESTILKNFIIKKLLRIILMWFYHFSLNLTALAALRLRSSSIAA